MAVEKDKIDSTIDIVTPENIAFQYQLAGPFRRLPAFVIDLLIRMTILVVLGIVLSLVAPLSGGLAIATFLIAFFVLDWFYGGVFETILNGQTPGKKMMGIRVLTVNGRPINGLQAVLRNILRTVDIMPIVPPAIPCFLVGIVVSMMNRRFQRLGDLVCGTIVVAEQRGWLTGIVRMEDDRVKLLAADLPANIEVGRGMARALNAYVDRRRYFSAVRRSEIARHLAEPLQVLYQLPANTSHDLLLCALYYRTFVADRVVESIGTVAGGSPFAQVSGGSVDLNRPPLPHETIAPISSEDFTANSSQDTSVQ